jgi:molecular chaperone DnaK
MGRHSVNEVGQDKLLTKRILYKIEDSHSQRGGIKVVFGGKHLTPQEVSAKILQRLKADAEAYLGHAVRDAIITVPAYFHDSQRQATRDAGRLAGLDVKRVLNEPTAACLAYGFKKIAEERKVIAVYDLGGGTFDISILEVGRGPFRVRSTNGNTLQGGDDLDSLILDWILDEIGGTGKVQLQSSQIALAHLRVVAEQVKIALSSAEEAVVQRDELLRFTTNVDIPTLTLTRTTLESLAAPLIAQTLESCRRALEDSALSVSDIEEVLLVGGQTRMPAIRQAVCNFFGREPNISVNPEEVVALGAAVQGAILSGKATGLRLADVVSLTLGVSTRGDMDPLIPRNASLPVRESKIYTTAWDNQEEVEIQIYQGEKSKVVDNFKLGSFTIKGIEPAPKGDPEIEVTFLVDQDGILHVSGRDLHTGNFKEITITDTLRLSDSDIERMIRDTAEDPIEVRYQVERLKEQISAMLVERERMLPDDLVITFREVLANPPESDWAAYLGQIQNLWQQMRVDNQT